MTYPLTSRTYFSDEHTAWEFAKAMAKLPHYIVSDYGVEPDRAEEPFFIETMNDPFGTKDSLMKAADLMAS